MVTFRATTRATRSSRSESTSIARSSPRSRVSTRGRTPAASSTPTASPEKRSPTFSSCSPARWRSMIPRASRSHDQIKDASQSDPDIHVLTNLSDLEINALQRVSGLCVQKSLREGFGLVVSEALWKGTPVVAGRVGGIPLQLEDGVSGFLVSSTEECADRILWLLQHPEEAKALGARGREMVRERFLLTRLIA